MSTAVFFKAIKPAKSPKAGKASKINKQGDGNPLAGLLSILTEHKVGQKFGPDVVKDDHEVTFKAGTFVGSGKVRATGKHGCKVEDEEGRAHDVRWHEVTGHKDGGSGKQKGNAEK
ncbi:hypothetical protein [Pararobbsia silviterrae]|uniref:Uncharacterized protein n=1 Tax=Pararobbsia silviterrae TaxID=1792498 RepID=A0A494X8G7_9BURK|nr:hypothetical protein [Pararobbsia silviterrae]RKP44666.1 hypothetical protein D7S86_26920 [Pararobbsia silviterrae]